MLNDVVLLDFWSNVNWQEELSILLRIFIGGVLGFAIGLERMYKQKEAGIATHFMVGFASALLTCISIVFRTYLNSDAGRIAAQVVSGIGFLGAGMIFFRRESLHGLTTAAGVWATAAIGMAVGAGMYIVAVGATAIVIVVQLVLHTKFFRRHNQRMLLVKYENTTETKQKLHQYFGVQKFSRFKLVKTDTNYVVEAVIRPSQNYTADNITNFTMNNPEIISIERLEDL